MAPLRLLLPLLSLGSTVLTHKDRFRTRCEDFTDEIDIPQVKVNFASYIPGGTNLSLVDNDPSCGASYQSVSSDVCRIAMSVATSNSSEITLEAWFPRDYTGRFLSTGNGGLSGCMSGLALFKKTVLY
jgi:feruloyl esterase